MKRKLKKNIFHLLIRSCFQKEKKCFNTQAIDYYEAALKSGRRPVMRMRLAELLFQLEYYEKCEKVLHEALDADQNPVGKLIFFAQNLELKRRLFIKHRFLYTTNSD